MEKCTLLVRIGDSQASSLEACGMELDAAGRCDNDLHHVRQVSVLPKVPLPVAPEEALPTIREVKRGVLDADRVQEARQALREFRTVDGICEEREAAARLAHLLDGFVAVYDDRASEQLTRVQRAAASLEEFVKPNDIVGQHARELLDAFRELDRMLQSGLGVPAVWRKAFE